MYEKRFINGRVLKYLVENNYYPTIEKLTIHVCYLELIKLIINLIINYLDMRVLILIRIMT